MKSKYNKNDFMKLYKIISDEDIEMKLKQDLSDDKSVERDLIRINKRIESATNQLNSTSFLERKEAAVTLKKLQIIRESYIIDESSREDRAERLEILITNLAPLLEKIVFNLIKLEEMEE